MPVNNKVTLINPVNSTKNYQIPALFKNYKEYINFRAYFFVNFRAFVPHMCYTPGMDIVLSHISALEYWRLYGISKASGSARQRRKRFPVDTPKFTDIRDKLPSGLSSPLHIVVGSLSGMRKSRLIRARVHTGPPPEGCVVGIDEGVAVSSAPFCLFQMAGELPLIKLIELGFEFCGTYALAVGNDYNPGEDTRDKTTYGRPPLTTKKAIKAFTNRMAGVKGQQKVSRALPFIADGSGSPMETILCLLLALPYKYGGFGLPIPELNRRIDLGNVSRRRARSSYYKCDLFWPSANVAVEYDSDFYHAGSDRIYSDSKRRFDLDELGIKVYTVTSKQLRDPKEFERIARRIARRLRKRLRYDESKFIKANRELRKLLL